MAGGFDLVNMVMSGSQQQQQAQANYEAFYRDSRNFQTEQRNIYDKFLFNMATEVYAPAAGKLFEDVLYGGALGEWAQERRMVAKGKATLGAMSTLAEAYGEEAAKSGVAIADFGDTSKSDKSGEGEGDAPKKKDTPKKKMAGEEKDDSDQQMTVSEMANALGISLTGKKDSSSKEDTQAKNRQDVKDRGQSRAEQKSQSQGQTVSQSGAPMSFPSNAGGFQMPQGSGVTQPGSTQIGMFPQGFRVYRDPTGQGLNPVQNKDGRWSFMGPGGLKEIMGLVAIQDDRIRAAAKWNDSETLREMARFQTEQGNLAAAAGNIERLNLLLSNGVITPEQYDRMVQVVAHGDGKFLDNIHKDLKNIGAFENDAIGRRTSQIDSQHDSSLELQGDQLKALNAQLEELHKVTPFTREGRVNKANTISELQDRINTLNQQMVATSMRKNIQHRSYMGNQDLNRFANSSPASESVLSGIERLAATSVSGDSNPDSAWNKFTSNSEFAPSDTDDFDSFYEQIQLVAHGAYWENVPPKSYWMNRWQSASGKAIKASQSSVEDHTEIGMGQGESSVSLYEKARTIAGDPTQLGSPEWIEAMDAITAMHSTGAGITEEQAMSVGSKKSPESTKPTDESGALEKAKDAGLGIGQTIRDVAQWTIDQFAEPSGLATAGTASPDSETIQMTNALKSVVPFVDDNMIEQLAVHPSMPPGTTAKEITHKLIQALQTGQLTKEGLMAHLVELGIYTPENNSDNQ
ncbi:MAG: hypothetical protein GOVbin2833_2 [Prokaryotic dsDNA virus sp.]|nr:MAG: hypothetical protein GOVbin2833_2 [Prokaryotic dsDNA virus sp.]|tara:strand:- start:33187 stop:35421 length:2235 start_codon:yes stop_codon:yes gene_type:complete